ncbi:hypothetical protein BDW42DRAFT_166030 [Aspergillus taichungensis]|uniref:Rhodopsin domain-containing protein n=1 Tax=Aspergillus taichungensis TaxID=482145 RepID=A0A2J5HZ32_9EURO|nr:hypothetical protein BDW42DRAFT_166030 [Aspergillus taichungensis]
MIPERGIAMIVIVAVLVGLGFITTILRVFARLKRRVGFGIDDYLSFGAMFLLIGMLIELVLWVTEGGNGTHMNELSPETLMNYQKIFLANQFTYFLLCPMIKISIICFYRRIFTMKPFRMITLGLNTLIALWGVAIFLTCALQCRPLRAYWDPSVEGSCIDGMKFIIANQAFNVLMDFAILALPVPMIWGLQRAWQDKLALNGVFALGGFVCFASIYRIVVLFWMDPADATYTVYQATLWTHIEPSIGLICACLPIVRGLFPKLKLAGSRRYTKNPYYINTDISTSHFATSVASPRSPNDYYKMEEGLSRAASDTTQVDNPYLGPLDISVRTDIKVDAASMRSQNSQR